jgi:two-component system, chemotaxis family, protein-glutamate methylesterase/glutaminase
VKNDYNFDGGECINIASNFSTKKSRDNDMISNRRYELLVIGGSAGSLAMVLQVLPFLKKEMNIAVIIIFHRKQSDDDTLIVNMLSSRTEFFVKEADDKDEIVPGTIYIAPSDYHVLIEKNKMLTLDASEKINFSRPSIDVSFESAADVYGSKLACMLLSGANADGVQGLKTAKDLGALIIVQDPASAEMPYMPREAIENVPVDLQLSYTNLAAFAALFMDTAPGINERK